MTRLPHSQYVSLTTFRRTGAPVATPVWAAPDGESLIVWTRADSGKVKRLRHTSRVTVAPCDVRGRVQAPPVDGVATFVDRPECPHALAALRRAGGTARDPAHPRRLTGIRRRKRRSAVSPGRS
jgi:PPOX class probable F420-dependent enzyme